MVKKCGIRPHAIERNVYLTKVDVSLWLCCLFSAFMPFSVLSMSFYNKLTVRYIFALSLVFLIMTATLSFLMLQLHSNERSGHIINISGMQRMLSQRIGLLSREIVISERLEDIEALVVKMDTAVQRMRLNHVELTTGICDKHNTALYSDTLDELYFGEDKIDKRVQSFLGLADAFIAVYQRDRLLRIRGGGVRR